MPAFIKDGPDIPERLLQAHEDGKVVFFCGAGISSAAGLPDFEGLVKRLYRNLRITLDSHQKEAIKQKQFDRAIHLLESYLAGGRRKVREEIAKILTPSNINHKTISTHKVLLKLARTLDGKTRLVTTNFDRLFEEVIPNTGYRVKCFSAPLLPIPKNMWNGLVYLHGLLPDESDGEDFDDLIVSSSDYGRAYLNERWAARFVSELFRNYTVCFVGYSLDDPVVRYMMDALAADRLRGETPLEMFAFADYSAGKEEQIEGKWKTKNVTPILYKKRNKHACLHKTLHKWAEIYRDGVSGKKMIISQYATTLPSDSPRDFVTGQILWAITDASAAKHFADLDPVPPLEWLKTLSKEQFDHEDLVRFGVAPEDKKDDQLKFSVTRRPSPYKLSSWMCLVDTGGKRSKMDAVMRHLARWLTRHLDDPELVLWLADRGGQLNEEFAQIICNRIEYLDQLKKSNEWDKLEQIRNSAPAAIPGPFMRALWNLFLTGKLKSKYEPNIYRWITRFKQHGLTPVLRMELHRLITSCVVINRPPSWRIEPGGAHESKIGWDIVLLGNNIQDALQDEIENEGFRDAWKEVLPVLLQDFVMLLHDALNLRKELGDARGKSDMSHTYHQPSISEHPQNHKHYDWTALIDLVRDAWLAVEKINPEKARRVVEDWWDMPYPLFKRLVFFAAANSDLITPEEALNWLLADEHRWLWSHETKRETIRLLVNLVPRLDKVALEKVERATIKGPTEDKRTDESINHETWLRLMKIKKTGVSLSNFAQRRLDELGQQNPEWELAENESDEFPFWLEVGEEKYVDELQTDEWRQLCQDNLPAAIAELCERAKKNEWPIPRWGKVLEKLSQTDTGSELLKESWQRAGPVLLEAPDSLIEKLRRSISFWLTKVAKVLDSSEDVFFSLIRRILDIGDPDNESFPRNESLPEYGILLPPKDERSRTSSNLITIAINHPVGDVTKALLGWWYRQKPKDAEGLRAEIKPIFNELCTIEVEEFSHGRLILAAHIFDLFRVDENWTKENLLPLFDWERSETEAASAWQGFLWSPRIYPPLLLVIKKYFLETVKHYHQLGECAGQFVDFLTFLALDPRDIFTNGELQSITSKLPPEGLERTVLTLTRALAGAGERRREYWHNRIIPYMRSVWPQGNEVKTPRISKYFALLCVEAGEVFPQAIRELRDWLQPIDDSYCVFYFLDKAELCKTFPAEALDLLYRIIDPNRLGLVEELNKCLDYIENFGENLTDDPRLQQLRRICENADN